MVFFIVYYHHKDREVLLLRITFQKLKFCIPTLTEIFLWNKDSNIGIASFLAMTAEKEDGLCCPNKNQDLHSETLIIFPNKNCKNSPNKKTPANHWSFLSFYSEYFKCESLRHKRRQLLPSRLPKLWDAGEGILHLRDRLILLNAPQLLLQSYP